MVTLHLLMAQPTEIPELATELFEMSKEYLRQETVEPMKRLGSYAGLGIGGGVVFAIATILGVLALYAGMQVLMNELLGGNEWYIVLARGITKLVAGIGAGLVGWRMSKQ